MFRQLLVLCHCDTAVLTDGPSQEYLPYVCVGVRVCVCVWGGCETYYRITRMFCEHQTFRTLHAMVDQFATIKSTKPKLLLVNTILAKTQYLDRKRSKFLLIWLIRKGFSPAKYSSNTVPPSCRQIGWRFSILNLNSTHASQRNLWY